ncbi:MAG: methionine--tRNA ligase [Clostridia bacterium]|nr:methionine--tRNA ligase [Clostridia bacterium]
MNKNKFYITTPIYYPSDKLHIGNTYTTVVSDAIARYKRMRGFDVMFLTGTDEHGEKLQQIAEKKGLKPIEYIDGIVASIKDLWSLMNISYDRFIRTTDDYHIESVQKIFKQLYDQGDIYLGSYEGLYCTPCEAFWTETQAVGGKCPDCGREVHPAKEEAYFFKMSKYADQLLKYIEEHPDFIEPESRRNEMVNNFLKPGLQDLCISRTSFDWGIPVPINEKHVIYVWIDALSNYITALGYQNGKYNDFEDYWPADVHVIGKDILRFHTIYWPIMLMALGLPLPKKVYGHGWLLIDGGKMSKSKGNVVDPAILSKYFGVDAIRYYLLSEISMGQDGNYTNELFINRINSDLANDLGNLLSRTTSMIIKYFGGVVPAPEGKTDFDGILEQFALDTVKKVEKEMDSYYVSNAVSTMMSLVSRANKYIDETAPWVLAKDEAKKGELASVMYHLYECLRFAAIMLKPIMPESSSKMALQLGISEAELSWDNLCFTDKYVGTAVTKGEALFPRIDAEKTIAEITAEAEAKKEPARKPLVHKEQVTIDAFEKLEIRAVKVLECEPVPKSDKLLKFIVDDGEGKRQIVSGIEKYYKPEELIGKTLAAIVNLMPVKLRGVESCGMLLSAESGDTVKVIMLDDSVEAGGEIR